MKLGELIRTTRTKQGYTLRVLGRALGCSGVYLSDIERGNRTPSKELKDKIAQVLGIARLHLDLLDVALRSNPLLSEAFSLLEKVTFEKVAQERRRVQLLSPFKELE